MEALFRQATDETPKVSLDADTGVFEFIGRSLPEDVTTFYNPILEWLDAYAESPKPVTEVHFKMVYFNTASSKLILDILFKIEELYQAGNDVSVKWYYQEDDEDMEEAGEEYADLIDVSFENVSYEELEVY